MSREIWIITYQKRTPGARFWYVIFQIASSSSYLFSLIKRGPARINSSLHMRIDKIQRVGQSARILPIHVAE